MDAASPYSPNPMAGPAPTPQQQQQQQPEQQQQQQQPQQQSPTKDNQTPSAGLSGWLPVCCTCRSASRFCLLYFTIIVLITLIFTALNAEPMDASQAVAWWAFVISLLVMGSLSCFVLVLVFYIECRRPDADPNLVDPEQSKGQARILIDDSRSASNKSFKTILTIESRPQDSGNAIKTIGLTPVTDQYKTTVQVVRPPGEQALVDQQLAFNKGQPLPNNDPVPISPAKSPVTVVDMQAMRKAIPKSATKSLGSSQAAKQLVAEAANMGAIPSITLVPDQDSDAPKPAKPKKKKKKDKDKDKDKKVAT